MFRFDAQMEDAAIRVAVDRAGNEMVGMVTALMDLVGAEVIAHLRSLTDEMQDPALPGEPERRAHPGHWADITGILANSYAWEVNGHSDGVTLVLTNNAEYAAALDAKDGYFVLRNVTDPGGPVEEVLRRVLAEVAPDWEVRFG